MAQNRREAILEGAQAAKRLHKELGAREALERGETRVDVFRAALDRGAELLFRSLNGPLGIYMNEHGEPGIIVSTNRELHVQRFTGAHELGHHVLGHRLSVDKEVGLWRGGENRSDPQEIAADAFATEFLMPQWLYLHHAKRHGWNRAALTRPEIIYQLSLRMGVSYEAACWGLVANEIHQESVARQLVESTPKVLKKSILGEIELENSWANVWEITINDNRVFAEGGPDDVFVFRLPDRAASGYLWNEDRLIDMGFTILADRREAAEDENLVGSESERILIVRATEPGVYNVRLDEQRPWLSSEESQTTITLAMDLYGKEKGVSRLQRRAFAS